MNTDASIKKSPSPEQTQEETLLEFPCRFPVKIMGRNETGFVSLITGIVLNYAKIFGDEAITTNHSGEGNFVAVTIIINAQSKTQLDRIYQDLVDCEQVLVAL